ncbi:DUF444 family protein [Candidatus Woesearchaeota archaeon]|nr:DUF444 family protein [Candidatus Woesearchaeota archaeon]
MGINQDLHRFRKIVKGEIRENLRDYLWRTDLFGKQGEKTVTIPVPQIEIPRFRFAEEGGVSQGEGKEGDSYDPDSGENGDAIAGDRGAPHFMEVEVSLEELAEMLGEELGLPYIEPKGEDRIISKKYRVKGIASVGPETLRSFPRGYKRALKRQIAEGTYDYRKPCIVPTASDMRYKALELVPTPQNNAAIIYMMDVSGSMGEMEKMLVRTTSFWLSTWIQRFYKGVEERFIIHDSDALEVDRETFFSTTTAGGTAFTPAYHLCMEIIAQDYDPSTYNIYPFHFSDGENGSRQNEDTEKAFSLLEDHLLPAVNMFGYGQCKTGKGDGQYLLELSKHFNLSETSAIIGSKVRAAKLADKNDIATTLRHFLRTGR